MAKPSAPFRAFRAISWASVIQPLPWASVIQTNPITFSGLMSSDGNGGRPFSSRRFFSRADLEAGRIRFKPDSLPAAAWGTGILYDPLEVIIR